MINKISKLIAIVTGFVVLADSLIAGQVTIQINPKSTYLLTSNDSGALNSVALELPELGLEAGDIVHLKVLGDWSAGNGYADTSNAMGAVFSGSDTIIDSSNQYRLPDAIDAGIDFDSGATFFNGYPTDISEDFSITTKGIIITIPQDAIYLFVGCLDSLFSDNSDPDGDYALLISEVKCDINNDCQISEYDLGIMAEQWLKTVTAAPLSADLNWDNTVNLFDFAILADNWLNYPNGCFPE